MLPDEARDQSSSSEIAALRRQLAELQETLEAIRDGEVDALVVRNGGCNRVYTLEGAEHVYRRFVEAMQQAAVTLSPDGTILFSNGRLTEMLRLPKSELVGTRLETHVAPPCREAWHALLRQAATRAQAAGELDLRRHDGGVLPVFVTLNSVTDAHGTVHCLVLSDLTAQKHYERMLAAEHGLKAALAAAEEASRAKDRFLAMLGHELRNPLAPMRNALALMKLGPADARTALTARDMIERQVTHLSRLVEDLLDVARIASGKIVLHRIPMDFAAVVVAAVADHRALLEAAGIGLDCAVPAEPVPILGDESRLSQILGNLLVNAGKFTQPGGRVAVRLRLDQGQAAVTVSDSGIGMTPETLAHLFEPFMQAGTSSERSGGLGLGLALVHALTRLHDGEVRAASAGPGLGSEFTLTLPVIAAAIPEPASPAAQPAPRGPSSRRVLVIEDNLDAAESLQMLLAFQGHSVSVTRSGSEGLERARAERPEFVLCDIGLPDMDGYRLAQALRDLPGMREAYIIAMTGFGQDEDRMRAFEAGFDNHLTKPADPDALLGLLAR
jgi:PAS domain S-box-containing protein